MDVNKIVQSLPIRALPETLSSLLLDEKNQPTKVFFASFAVVALLSLVVLFLLLVKIFRKSSAKNNTILLIGNSNAGKTLLFLQLRDNTPRNTVTSMKENDDTFLVENDEGQRPGAVHVVDIPGHERLRHKLRDYLPIAKGIVFVVDAAEFLAESRPVAEFLYDVLKNKVARKKRLPILIACNKSDIVTAVSKDRIKSLLEKEIETLRTTQKAIPEQNEEDDSGKDLIEVGIPGEPFRFDHLQEEQRIRVEFVTCSAKYQQNVSDIKRYMYSLIK